MLSSPPVYIPDDLLAVATPDEIDAYLAYLRGEENASSPVAFMRRAGLEPDPWQAEVLTAAEPQLHIVCSRQAGKSTVVGSKAMHRALYKPDALVLILAPSQRQSAELFRKAVLPFRVGGVVDEVPRKQSAMQLELTNGSRIIALPGKDGTVRGYSGPDLIIIDEAAWVPDALYYAIRPMLAVSGGQLVVLSTPHGTRGWYYNIWKDQNERRAAGESLDWRLWEVPASAVGCHPDGSPRIPQAFLDSERRRMGDWWFEQEYMCRFLDAETALFRSEDIEAMADEAVEAWDL